MKLCSQHGVPELACAQCHGYPPPVSSDGWRECVACRRWFVALKDGMCEACRRSQEGGR